MHLGLARGSLGDFERAHAEFDRSDRSASQQSVSLVYSWYRGIVLGLEGSYAEAIPIVHDVVHRIPRYATARVTLAIAYEITGAPDRARANIERADALDPGLNVDGIALNVGAHPDPEQGRIRDAILRRYWPNS